MSRILPSTTNVESKFPPKHHKLRLLASMTFYLRRPQTAATIVTGKQRDPHLHILCCKVTKFHVPLRLSREGTIGYDLAWIRVLVYVLGTPIWATLITTTLVYTTPSIFRHSRYYDTFLQDPTF